MKKMILIKKLVKMKHKTFTLKENFKATERQGIGVVTPLKELIPPLLPKVPSIQEGIIYSLKESDYIFAFFFSTLKCHVQQQLLFTIKNPPVEQREVEKENIIEHNVYPISSPVLNLRCCLLLHIRWSSDSLKSGKRNTDFHLNE